MGTKYNFLLGENDTPTDKNAPQRRIKGFGKTKHTIALSTTPSNTSELYIEGLTFGQMYNGSTNQITITWYSPANMISGSTASPITDSANNAVTSIVNAKGTQDLPSALASAKYLMPQGSIATTLFSMHFER